MNVDSVLLRRYFRKKEQDGNDNVTSNFLYAYYPEYYYLEVFVQGQG